jgi:hypothetical protein
MFSLICRILGRTHEIKMGTISDLEGIKGWAIMKYNRETEMWSKYIFCLYEMSQLNPLLCTINISWIRVCQVLPTSTYCQGKNWYRKHQGPNSKAFECTSLYLPSVKEWHLCTFFSSVYSWIIVMFLWQQARTNHKRAEKENQLQPCEWWQTAILAT